MSFRQSSRSAGIERIEGIMEKKTSEQFRFIFLSREQRLLKTMESFRKTPFYGPRLFSVQKSATETVENNDTATVFLI